MCLPDSEVSVLISQFLVHTDITDTKDVLSAEYAKSIASLIDTGKVSLRHFVQSLGSHITSDSDFIRAKSVKCLGTTVSFLGNSSSLSHHDILVILDFILVKLDDTKCSENALDALAGLVRCKHFRPHENIRSILVALTKRYDHTKLLARTRHQAFILLQEIINIHLKEIVAKPATSDLYIQAFLHVAVGEKDPRNLLLSFSLNRCINTSILWDDLSVVHASFINELFDVCFCYFPIAFTPPANDPYQIKPDELKVELTRTIASQLRFANDAFGNLLEKLASTNPIVRNDTIKTILACVQTYLAPTLGGNWVALWTALKFEIIHGQKPKFLAASNMLIPPDFDKSLKADELGFMSYTLAIMRAFSARLLPKDLLKFCETVALDLNELLSFEKETTVQASLIVAAVISGSISASTILLKYLFSYNVWGKFFGESGDASTSETVVLNTCQTKDLVFSLGLVLAGYMQLEETEFHENRQGGIDSSLATNSTTNELYKHKDQLVLFLGQLLMTLSFSETELKQTIILQLVEMILLQQYLSPNDIELIYGYFGDLLVETMKSVSNWDTDPTIHSVIDAIAKTTLTREEMTMSLILNRLLYRLDEAIEAVNLEQTDGILQLICRICCKRHLLELASVELLRRADSLVLKSPVSSPVEVVNLVFNRLELCIKETQINSPFLMNPWIDSFLVEIVSIVIRVCDKNNQDLVFYDTAGYLVGLVIKFSDYSLHERLLDDTVKLFFTDSEDQKFKTDSNLLKQGNLMIGIVTKVFANIDKRCSFSAQLESGLVYKQIQQLIPSLDGTYLRVEYLQLISLLVNKFETQSIDLVIKNVLKTELETIQGNGITNVVDFEIFVWLLKGLVVKCDDTGFDYLRRLCSVFTDNVSDSGRKQLVAQSLGVIFADVKVYLNTTPSISPMKLVSKVRSLNVKMLFKQHAFSLILPQIKQGHSQESRQECLMALSVVVETLPTAVIIANSDTILPIILQGVFTGAFTRIVQASLTALKIIIKQDSSQIETHVPSIVPSLVNLAVSHSSDTVRHFSLEALMLIFQQCATAARLKDQCNAELRSCLHDKRRHVRRAACDLRQVLYEMR